MPTIDSSLYSLTNLCIYSQHIPIVKFLMSKLTFFCIRDSDKEALVLSRSKEL